MIIQSWWHIAPLVKLQIVFAEDNVYNNEAWAVNVQEKVNPYLIGTVALLGHKKDNSSFYIDMFPQWGKIIVPELEPLDASNVRKQFFQPNFNINFLSGVTPQSTFDFLKRFLNSEEYKNILEETEYIKEYKKPYANLPYPPVFVTSDAVVFQSGNVLMVRRRARPGKNLLAFPGGFLNANTDRSVLDCMIRELLEETKIKIPEIILRRSIVNERVFDAINRSARGRIITHAFNIQLNNEHELPKVKGSDDAAKAMWIPISQVNRSDCFEDHYDILQYFVGRSK
jgi:bifunctional NMN adenylyltransferase/nudix hydrolase